MSFMDKITSRPRDARADTAAFDSQFDDVVTAEPERSGRDTQVPRLGTPTQAPDTRARQETRDSSINSEVTPSEMGGDFSETRVQYPDADDVSKGKPLPLIGHLPQARQQRVLFGLVGAGLLGLAVSTTLALSSASRNSDRVGSVGQALMESQRMAKSVSQAMVGVPAAFPELKDSADVLTRNVRGLGEGGLACPFQARLGQRIAVDHHEMAPGIDEAGIARLHPAIGREQLCVGGVVVVVAGAVAAGGSSQRR